MSCNKGYSLVEMLVALSIFCILSAFILPSFVLIAVERKNVSISQQANELLAEEIHYFHTLGKRESDVITMTNMDFQVQWSDDKICVGWEDFSKRTIEKCRNVKQ